MSHRFFVCAVSTCLLVLSPCSRPPALSAPDRREIINDALSKALIQKRIPDYFRLRDQKRLIVSSALISAGDLPSLPGLEFELLTEEAIHSRANEIGGLWYLRFAKFEVLDSEHVVVQLDKIWAMNDSDHGLGSGSGIIVEYSKRTGRWVGECNKVWIS